MKVLDVIRIKGRSGQLAVFQTKEGDPEPATDWIFRREGADDEWVVMGIEVQGRFYAGKPLGLLLSPTITTIEEGLPWIAVGDELCPKPRETGKCMWCDAKYSTDEEVRRHLDDRRHHVVERLAAMEKLAERLTKKAADLMCAAHAVAVLQPATHAKNAEEARRWERFYESIRELESP